MADKSELQEKIRALSEAYAAQLPEKLEQIEQMWQQIPRDRWDETGFETLHRMVHSLTGSGKTFGFPLLSEASSKLEEYLKQLTLPKTILSKAQRSHIEGLMRELQNAARH